jgi:hypothetical protein
MSQLAPFGSGSMQTPVASPVAWLEQTWLCGHCPSDAQGRPQNPESQASPFEQVALLEQVTQAPLEQTGLADGHAAIVPDPQSPSHAAHIWLVVLHACPNGQLGAGSAAEHCTHVCVTGSQVRLPLHAEVTQEHPTSKHVVVDDAVAPSPAKMLVGHDAPLQPGVHCSTLEPEAQ